MAVIWLPKISSLRSRGPFAVCGDSARTSALRELVRDCRGVVAVQFLFLMFPLLLLLLGTFDIGLAMLTANRINFAVEAAAKCGAVGSAMCARPAGNRRAKSIRARHRNGSRSRSANRARPAQATGSARLATSPSPVSETTTMPGCSRNPSFLCRGTNGSNPPPSSGESCKLSVPLSAMNSVDP